MKVEDQLSALKNYVNCELSILRNQIKSFTEHTKMSLGHENGNIGALHKNITFLQNELAEKNKTIKSLMEKQTAVLDVMTDLRQQPNTPEQNVNEHLSQESFIKDLTITEKKIIQEKSNAKEIRKLERKRK